MPASHDELGRAFFEMTGHYYAQEPYAGYGGSDAGNANEWIDLFQETGIDFESTSDTVGAFEDFLIAFYPQEGMTGDDWWFVRQEFYEIYQVNDHSIDWEAYRATIGY
jgi:hypothetical protein